MAWHPDQEGWYDVAEHTCHACGALMDNVSTDREPARDRRHKFSIVDTRPSDRPLYLPPPMG